MGTTLEILAPYLRWRPYAQCPHGVAPIERLYTDYQFPADGRLEEAAGIWEELEPGGTRTLRVYRMRDVTPVLRPFSSLCTPLPDGTIPAVEVAKLLIKELAGASRINHGIQGGSVFVTAHGDPYPSVTCEDLYPALDINPDWSFSIYNGDATLGVQPAIDYLRRNHFAVGLSAGQYIPKL